jgi:hypothetical protein
VEVKVSLMEDNRLTRLTSVLLPLTANGGVYIAI